MIKLWLSLLSFSKVFIECLLSMYTVLNAGRESRYKTEKSLLPTLIDISTHKAIS